MICAFQENQSMFHYSGLKLSHNIWKQLTCGMMPIANIMKMRKKSYFNISTDSRVKVVRLLNNIVVIAQITLFRSQNCV